MDTKEKPNEAKTRKALCEKCGQYTNHAVLNHASKQEYWDEIGEGEYNDYFTLQCLGCDTVCLLIEYVYTENINPETGNPETQIIIYPSPVQGRKEIDKIYHVPD